MWLLGRLYPDHKSIAEFRRMHRDAVTAAGVELVRFARSCGLIRGDWIAIDGTKFRAVASIDSTRERLALQRYLDSIDKADEEKQASIDPPAVQAALEKLKQHPEPEVGFMLVRQTALLNVQTAVDAEHALIVAHAVITNASERASLRDDQIPHLRTSTSAEGLSGARAEIGIATMAYNLKRITNVLGAARLTKALRRCLIKRNGGNHDLKPVSSVSQSISLPLRLLN